MRVAIVCAALGAGLVAGRGAAAADPRSIEASGFFGVDYFGDDIELGNSWAMEQKPGTALLMGVRLAYIALPNVTHGDAGHVHLDLGAEAEVKFAAAFTSGSFDGGRGSYFAPVIGWRGHALARLAGLTRHFAPHVVVGGGGESVASTSPYMVDDTDAVFYYGVGAIWSVSAKWAVRLDARHGFTAGRTDTVTQTFEIQLGAGARWDLGSTKRPPPPLADADGDGIVDDLDQCPSEAETENGFEDNDGCPDSPDQDVDGIPDADDRCPTEPENKNGIDDDDGCPDADDDGDGILGSKDACPTEAEDIDGFEDQDGCPDLDNDNDGVPDPHDGCPVEPEVWNGIQDDDGCPDELPAKVKAFEGTMKGINFQNGKSKILPSSKKVLAKTVAILREFPQLRIKIEGHTDDKGKRDKNLALSRHRADAVKWYLVDQGVAEDRLETEGVGPDRPIADNKKKGGRARNRRIEFHILPTVQPGTAPAPATQPSP